MKLDLKHMAWLTPDRLQRYAMIWAVAAMAIFAVDLYGRTSQGLSSDEGMVFGTDFVSFWGGGHFAAKRELEQAYDFLVFKEFHDELLGREDLGFKYDYPPIAALFLIPFALLPYVPGFFVWVALSIAAFAAGLRPVLTSWRISILAVLATPAMFLNLVLGQNAGFTAGLMGGALSILERRPALAGVLIGLLAFKPQLAVLVPFAFIAIGAWRSFIWAAATVIFLTGASLLVFGVSGWEAFIAHSRINGELMLAEEMYAWTHMVSVFISVRLFGLDATPAFIVQGTFSLASVVIVTLVWRRDIPIELKSSVLVVASFFVTPYLHVYDFTILTFVVFWRTSVQDRFPFLPWEKLTLAAALLLPLVNANLVDMARMPIGPLILFALLILQVRVALSAPQQNKGQPQQGPALT